MLKPTTDVLGMKFTEKEQRLDELKAKEAEEKIMAKIVVRLPEPKKEYDISNQKQINRALTTVVEQLNSTFLETEKEEQQRFNFFLS